jgi:fatty-acyl-CoA synthase
MLAHTLRLLYRSGVVAPIRPDRLVGMARALMRFGMTAASAYAAGAARHPDHPALVDEHGVLTYAEVDQRTDRLARALADRRIGPDTRVAVLCRNHRGPVEVITACAKVGADVVLLNTGMSAEQLGAVLVEQNADLLIADQDFDRYLEFVPARCSRALAWVPDEAATTSAGLPTVESMIREGGRATLPSRPPLGKLIVLTSGTTGTPKGARRPTPKGFGPAGAILSRIPVRYGEAALVSAPLFHSWGFAAFQLGMLHGQTLVLQRRFDPAAALAAIERHRIATVYAVPVMLQRLLELPPDRLEQAETSSLRVVAVSGSALSAALATRFADVFGAVLYNLYGSTEVSWATIATPQDMRTSPGTVGTAPLGTVLRVLGSDNQPVPAGREGRIFVGNDMLFEGYTRAGAGTEAVDGLIGTGDIGRVDEHGLLHITGRSDDMIVSGGENVHPGPVEDLICGWPEVREAAVLGVEDKQFGQRLAAYLVLVPGATLDAETVRGRVRETLAQFAVPRDVEFLDELPRNATGKIVKRALIS